MRLARNYITIRLELDRCAGICNTLDDISDEVSAPNETEGLNLLVFNMVVAISESKILTKHKFMEIGM